MTIVDIWHRTADGWRSRVGTRGGASIAGWMRGAKPVGTTTYPVPAGAIHVSTTGDDGNAGTQAAPYRTIKRAAAQAPANSTIVAHEGVYHEGGLYPDLGGGIGFNNAGVTVQSAPNEAVWLDGSEIVGGWVQDGATWKAPVALTLDRAPTQTRGEQVSGYGSFLVPEYPIAHWPEMLLLDGQQLEQVQTVGEVGPGKFFVQGAGGTGNTFTSTHYVIGNNPAGREVRVGKLARAISIGGGDITIRGIGVRNYVPAMPDWGCIYWGNDQRGIMEHVVMQDISTEAIHTESLNGVIRYCTFQRCGQKGIGTNKSDGITIEWCEFADNNSRTFNFGPDGGSIKVTRCQHPIVRFNYFHGTRGHSVWYDESVLEPLHHSNWHQDEWGRGVLVEISARGWVVNNVIIRCGINSTLASRPAYDSPAIWISGSDLCEVWHNTMIGNEVGIKIAQDARDPFDADSWGRDPRQNDDFYRNEMTWNVQNIVVKNNVFADMAGINDTYSVFAYFFDGNTPKTKSTQDFGPDFAGNLYAQPASDKPTRFAMGYQGAEPTVYWDRTGTPYGDTVSWVARTGDSGSYNPQVIAAISDEASGAVTSSALSLVTPAAVPAQVTAILTDNLILASTQPVGAGIFSEVAP